MNTKPLLIALTSLLLTGNAFAGANINGFAYQLQKAADSINVSAQGDSAGNSNSVVGSQVVYSSTAVNVNGRLQQEIHTNSATVNAAGAEDSTVGIQVVKSDGALNINGALAQLLYADDVTVLSDQADGSIVGAQVVHARGYLKGTAQQHLDAENIDVTPSSVENAQVAAQIMSGR